MFIDEAVIHVRGGKGGAGCVAFRREKYVPRGGPDGGDGGNGGSVRLRADANMATLLDFASRPLFAGENGARGRGKNQHGRNGGDIVVRVPCGTIVSDSRTGMVLRDLGLAGETVLVAGGGKGGRGNKSFATSTHRTPREYEKGEPGEDCFIKLDLKLIADVGLVGMPNAGKSTLLSRVSAARPKIAAYPFTTREPNLGIAEVSDGRRIVFADLPGLIEGAHAGHGLGDEFLKHIERTRIICQVVDLAPLSGPDAAQAYRLIRDELKLYDAALAAKPHNVAANKMDLTEAKENLRAFRRKVKVPVVPISAVTGLGIRALLEKLAEEVVECS